MKKIIVILPIIVVALIVFSFVVVPEQTDEVKITVTAEKQTLFDVFQTNPVKTTKRLKTPYEFTVKTADNKLIFKSQDQKSNIKVNVIRSNGSVLREELPIVVVILRDEWGEIFGID